MTKQEILDAINSTIVTNGVKGITAESLANILTEIVNAAPEGGSGGSGAGTIRLSNYELIEQDKCVLISTNEEDAAHNAETFSKYVAAANSGYPISLLMDVTKSIGVNLMQFADTDSVVIMPQSVMYMADIDMMGALGVFMGTSFELEMGSDGHASCVIPLIE